MKNIVQSSRMRMLRKPDLRKTILLVLIVILGAFIIYQIVDRAQHIKQVKQKPSIQFQCYTSLF